MRRALTIVSYFIVFMAGFGVAILLPRLVGSAIDTQWKQLARPAEGQGISYSTEVFVKSDLPSPAITKLTGEAKFIEGDNFQTAGARLGYKVTVDVGPVNLSKVPKKYLTEKPVNVGGTTITQLPIKQVSHDIHFEFTLKDKDGFKLLEAQSEPHTLESGKTNTFQGIAMKPVPASIAARTAQIVFHTSVDKCITCESE